MPEDFKGFSEGPHIEVSQAAGGGKRRSNDKPGFEGHSESNLDESMATKAAKKGEKK